MVNYTSDRNMKKGTKDRKTFELESTTKHSFYEADCFTFCHELSQRKHLTRSRTQEPGVSKYISIRDVFPAKPAAEHNKPQ